MTQETFLQTIGKSDLISPALFKAWTFEIMQSKAVTTDAARNALHPLKVHQTMIGKFLCFCYLCRSVYFPLFQHPPCHQKNWGTKFKGKNMERKRKRGKKEDGKKKKERNKKKE